MRSEIIAETYTHHYRLIAACTLVESISDAIDNVHGGQISGGATIKVGFLSKSGIVVATVIAAESAESVAAVAFRRIVGGQRLDGTVGKKKRTRER